MTTAHIANSHLTSVISSTSRTFTVNKRFFWYGCSNILERTNNLVSLSRGNRFKFTYCHFLFKYCYKNQFLRLPLLLQSPS